MHIFNHVCTMKLFQQRREVVELSIAMKYMVFPENMYLEPLNIDTQGDRKEITIGVKTTSFIFSNIYKPCIIASISRYYYGKYKISLVLMPLPN